MLDEHTAWIGHVRTVENKIAKIYWFSLLRIGLLNEDSVKLCISHIFIPI